MTDLISSKQGNVILMTSIFVIVILLFGIFSIIGYNTYHSMMPDLTEDVTLNESTQILNDVDTRMPSVFDALAITILAGIWIIGIASVLMSDDHPILFGFMMIALIFIIIAGVFLGNAWEEFFQDADFAATTSSFPMTYYVSTHMLIFGILVGFTILLARYAKNKL